MGPCAVSLENGESPNMAVHVDGVYPGERHVEHVCANTQQYLLMGRWPSPSGSSLCMAGPGPSGAEMPMVFSFMRQLAACGTWAQESGAVAFAPMCSQYSGTFWLVAVGDDAGEGSLDAWAPGRANGERNRAVQKTGQTTYVRCLKLDSVNTSLGW